MKRPWRAPRCRPTARIPDLRVCALVSIGALWGCRSDTVAGRNTVEMMEPIAGLQAASRRQAEASSDIVAEEIPPRADGLLADPAYPTGARTARAGDTVVYVTITIDTTGAVSDVIPSWGRLNIPNRYSEEFLAAVRTCVRRWKFEPARVVYWARDGDQGRRYLYTEAIPSRTDVKFTFTAPKDFP